MPPQSEMSLLSERPDYPRLPRYTLPDFNRTLWGRLMQKIVDYLHSSGD